MMRPLAILGLAIVVGCSDTELPPLGEAVIIVDTDLAVPTLTNRLRIDVYTADGQRWYESREIGRVDPSDWPVSFSVFDPDPNATRTVLVRLRAFPNGLVRDYHGERYLERPEGGKPGDVAPVTPPPDDDGPRLLDARGTDKTPSIEPEPLVTVDRLLLVGIEPGKRGSVHVVLRGRCAGTMANLAELATCIDQENERVAVRRAELAPSLVRPTKSEQGMFGAPTPCAAELRTASTSNDGTPLFDEEICVPGGAFLFGNVEMPDDSPVRLAVLPPFRMDRYEVTVGRWRDALARGFIPVYQPVPNENPTFAPGPVRECTWSKTNQKRETFPLSCVAQPAAREFCQFIGGDLPSEAQFEYVAESVGRTLRTRYPWGNDDPDCDRAIFSRDNGAIDLWTAECLASHGYGPRPVDDTTNDRALATGAVGLAGNVAELTLDAFHSFKSICWARNGIDSPHCEDPSADYSFRGGSWADNLLSVRNGWRAWLPNNPGGASSILGFRCVRRIE